jgi:hypothetical protein
VFSADAKHIIDAVLTQQVIVQHSTVISRGIWCHLGSNCSIRSRRRRFGNSRTSSS